MVQKRYNCPYCEQQLRFDEHDQTYQCPHCGNLGTLEQVEFLEKAINQKYFDERKIETHAILNDIHSWKFEDAKHRIQNCLSSQKYQDHSSQFLFSLFLFLAEITGDFDFLTGKLKIFEVSKMFSYKQFESYKKLLDVALEEKEKKTVDVLLKSIKDYLSEYLEYKQNYKEREIYLLCDDKEVADKIFNKALKGSPHESFTDYCDGNLSDAKGLFFLSSARIVIIYISNSKNTPYADYVLGEYSLMTSFSSPNKKLRKQVLLLNSDVFSLNHLSKIVKEDMILKTRSVEKAADELREVVSVIFDSNFTTIEEENRKFSQYEAQIAPMVNKDYLDNEEHKTLNCVVDNYIEGLRTFKIRFNEAPQAGYTDDKLRGLKKKFDETKSNTNSDLERWKEKYIKYIDKCDYFLNKVTLNDENLDRVKYMVDWCKEHKDKIEDILGLNGMVQLFGKTKYADIQTVYSLNDGYETRYKELKNKINDILSLEESLTYSIKNANEVFFSGEKLKGMVNLYKEKRENYGKDPDFNNWVHSERKLHYYNIEFLEKITNEAIRKNEYAKSRTLFEKAEPVLNSIKNCERDLLAALNNNRPTQNDVNFVNNLFSIFKEKVAKFRADFPSLSNQKIYSLSKCEIRNGDDFTFLEGKIQKFAERAQFNLAEQKKKNEEKYLSKAREIVRSISFKEKDIISFISCANSAHYNPKHATNLFESYKYNINSFKEHYSKLGEATLNDLLSMTQYGNSLGKLQNEINAATNQYNKRKEEDAEKLVGYIRSTDDKICDILENPSFTSEEETYLREKIEKQKINIKTYVSRGGSVKFTLKKDGFTLSRSSNSALEQVITSYRKTKKQVISMFDQIKTKNDELYVKQDAYFARHHFGVTGSKLNCKINVLKDLYKSKIGQLAIKYGKMNHIYLRYPDIASLEVLKVKIATFMRDYGY